VKYLLLLLLLLAGVSCGPLASNSAQPVPQIALAKSDPDFSIVVFPDTQYYSGKYNYVFQDQANWVVANQSRLNIKAVVGMGDIVDAGGYPVDSSGKVAGSCQVPPPSGWQTDWQQAQSSINILESSGIYYQATIGNHDYDCEADRPQPRTASNYFHYFGQLPQSPDGYIRDQSGNRTPNFYKTLTIGSTKYMILSLELFPRSSIIAAANNLISNFPGPVILATHAYLASDGSGPTFGATAPPGSAYPLCSGFPDALYHCKADSLASYNPVGGGTDGVGLWYQLVSQHPNILMTLSGHVRNPDPGDYPNVPLYNGVGYVDCNVQSWTTLCSSQNRPIQILSDFQGQGNGGYFGYGYLRVLTISPSNKTVSVTTYSPSIAKRPANFPARIPAQRTDHYGQFTLNFPPTFGGPDKEITNISSPQDGSHVSSTFAISAAASGPDSVNGMQIYVDGVNYASYPNVDSLPANTEVRLSGPGTHRIAVQSYDEKTSSWVKSAIYVTTP
jgi:hypothetical protein